jgi:TPR repeat protein
MKSLMLGLLLAAAAIAQQTEVPAPESLNSLRAQAEKGDTVAQYNLAVVYERGEGVPPDYVEAVLWCRKAADHRFARKW